MPPLLRHRYLSFALSLSVFLLGIIGVEYFFGWRTLLAPWQSMTGGQIGWAVLLLAASYLFRAQRIACYFRPLAPTHVRLLPTLRLVLLHNSLNNLLPMRTGEISFPILVQRYFSIDLTTSVPALLWLRFMDLHTLGIISLIALSGVHSSFLFPGILLILIWTPLPALVLATHPLAHRWAKRHPDGRMAKMVCKVIQGLPQKKQHFFKLWGYTVINWVAKIIAFTWVLNLFVHAGILPSLLGSIAGDMTSVLPFHGLAGAGTYEAGVMAGLALFGVSAETGVPAAINLHLFVLGGSFLAVLPALMIPVKSKKTGVALESKEPENAK